MKTFQRILLGRKKVKTKYGKKKFIVNVKVFVKIVTEKRLWDGELAKFKAILSEFVWFAVPRILVFYSRKTEPKEEGETFHRVSWFGVLNTTAKDSSNFEKPILIVIFALFISVWVIVILLATLGSGRRCLYVVQVMTSVSVLSVVGFIDYLLYKTPPELPWYEVPFLIHFLVMVLIITIIWKKYTVEWTWHAPSIQKSWHFFPNGVQNLMEDEMQDLNRKTNSRKAWLMFLSLSVSLSIVILRLWHLKTFERKKLL